LGVVGGQTLRRCWRGATDTHRPAKPPRWRFQRRPRKFVSPWRRSAHDPDTQIPINLGPGPIRSKNRGFALKSQRQTGAVGQRQTVVTGLRREHGRCFRLATLRDPLIRQADLLRNTGEPVPKAFLAGPAALQNQAFTDLARDQPVAGLKFQGITQRCRNDAPTLRTDLALLSGDAIYITSCHLDNRVWHRHWARGRHQSWIALRPSIR
jgi:hypothetical protein